MKTEEKAEQIFEYVAAQISPTREEAEREKEFALSLVGKLEKALSREEVRVYFVGSTARDTGLHLEKDVDLFIAFPLNQTRDSIVAKVIAATKNAIPAQWQMHYAEHPYLQAQVGDYKVEVIPCFQISAHEQIKSAVDRSPLHMDYLQKRLSPRQKRDVRLLKAMLKRARVYGAEASVGGFSGLLCEYLVLNHRSLWNLLSQASKWKQPVVIDIEGGWRGREQGLRKKFEDAPLVLVDAIDRNRNAAAAVSAESLATFASMAQAFIRSPSRDFFFDEEKAFSRAQVLRALSQRGTFLYALELPRPKNVVDDVLFPQARRALHSLNELIAREEFVLFDSELVFSQEKMFFVLELANNTRPGVKLFLGPPVWLVKDVIEFAKKHARALRGPFVRGVRIVAEEKRLPTKAIDFLWQLIKSPRGIAVGKHLLPAWKRARLLEGKAIAKAMSESEFKELARFVFKKAFWL